MPKGQCVDQGRWKLQKGSGDAVGQFNKGTVSFFTSADMSQVRYLPSVTSRFFTKRLSSVVSWRNQM